VALRCTLNTLDLKGTALYVAGRIKIAGGNPMQLFTAEAVELVHARSHGIPRLINVICDNALLSGFGAGCAPIGASTVLEACRDLDVDAPRPPVAATLAPPRALPTPAYEEVNATVPIVGPVPFAPVRPALVGTDEGRADRAGMFSRAAAPFTTRRS
jgi:general secretion pathway protein A